MLEAIARTFEVDVATSKVTCIDLMRANPFDVVVASERLSDGSGLELLVILQLAGRRRCGCCVIEPDRLKPRCAASWGRSGLHAIDEISDRRGRAGDGDEPALSVASGRRLEEEEEEPATAAASPSCCAGGAPAGCSTNRGRGGGQGRHPAGSKHL